jgi:hypothetical protein
VLAPPAPAAGDAPPADAPAAGDSPALLPEPPEPALVLPLPALVLPLPALVLPLPALVLPLPAVGNWLIGGAEDELQPTSADIAKPTRRLSFAVCIVLIPPTPDGVAASSRHS